MIFVIFGFWGYVVTTMVFLAGVLAVFVYERVSADVGV
jgi:hypothetical protein